jgi:hypothetical protein
MRATLAVAGPLFVSQCVLPMHRMHACGVSAVTLTKASSAVRSSTSSPAVQLYDRLCRTP